MKNLILLSLLSLFPLFTNAQVKGKVINSETSLPLPDANIIIEGKNIGASSDKSGEFTLLGNIREGDILVASYIGFNSRKIILSKEDFINPVVIQLVPAIIPSQTILVEASVGKEGFTPLTYEKINRENIENNYTLQDIPQFLGDLPSTTFYSENGNGIGYNYLSIRGFDQRRISVSINGIPQNDPEDHEVYWLDFPDLLASTELIQVHSGGCR
jgi:iron complex outermembrane receptor protein